MKNDLKIILAIAIFFTLLSYPHIWASCETLFQPSSNTCQAVQDALTQIRKLERQARKKPFCDKTIYKLARSHNNAGRIYKSLNKPTHALNHFEIAVSQQPENTSFRTDFFLSLSEENKKQRAAAQALEIVRLNPNNYKLSRKIATACLFNELEHISLKILASLYSEEKRYKKYNLISKIYLDQGLYLQSLVNTKKSLTISPGNHKAKEMLKQLRNIKQVKNAKLQSQYKNFEITYPALLPHELLKIIHNYLETCRKEIGTLLEIFPEDITKVILLFESEFTKIAPPWAGSAYDGRIIIKIPSYSFSLNKIEPKIRHEYTHHILDISTMGNCPLWLNEGLAQIFEHNKSLRSLPKSKDIDYDYLKSFEKDFSSEEEAKHFYTLAKQSTARLLNDIGWTKATTLLKLLKKMSFNKAFYKVTGKSTTEYFDK